MAGVFRDHLLRNKTAFVSGGSGMNMAAQGGAAMGIAGLPGQDVAAAGGFQRARRPRRPYH